MLSRARHGYRVGLLRTRSINFVDGEYEYFEGDLSISDSVKPQTSTKFSENVTQVLESFYYDMNMDGWREKHHDNIQRAQVATGLTIDQIKVRLTKFIIMIVEHMHQLHHVTI